MSLAMKNLSYYSSQPGGYIVTFAEAKIMSFPIWKRAFSKLLRILVFGLAAAISSPAQTFTTLVIFDGSNGSQPELPPVQGVDGNLYGVTSYGERSLGTVYRMTPEGVLTTLYNFCSQITCLDGALPLSGLIQDVAGNLYGTTTTGGANKSGTVFKITIQGELTTLYTFCSQIACADGSNPNGLLLATDGNFYGTTMIGGANGLGTIFKMTPQGVLTTLYSFCSQPNCADGYDSDQSFGTLIEGVDGNFYGTTDVGGSNAGACLNVGCGTAYKITPQGKFTTLHTFCSKANCPDGMTPYWLIRGADGSFYGATGGGGSNQLTGGTIFRLTTKGTLTTLYSFCAEANCADGQEPIYLAQGAGGANFYGATFRGGPSAICPGGCGTLFEITSTGTLTSLHSFDRSDGDMAYGLTQATNGTFYGTTSRGGGYTDGTVFSLATGLPPFVETLPQFGKVGSRIVILGTDLTGTTSVSFHGTAATFSVISSSEIRAVVPQGATTGAVVVTTPGGALSSNVVFRVK
jgi:uncharacterized repeat protein (TIGR03803 family)